MARLLCVVDSYDAMSSLRLYRQARTYRECLVELEVGKGTQFDPHMVDVFVAVLEDLHELKGEALVTAWEAAADIDGAMHGRLADPQAASEDEQARVTAMLGEAARHNQTIAAMATEVRIDEHRSMIVTVCSDDPRRVQRRGEILLSDQEQMEAYAGRPMDTNVLYIDDQGAWVCGLAPIFGAGGEIVGLVRSEVPATDVTGPLGKVSSVRETFAGLARDAASRLTRVEIDSMIDGLSGLYNHRYLHERLSEEVARAHAEGSQITILFCDVDNFKRVNDLHGHRVGDDLLRRMAHAIGKAIRRVDLAARYGGDEFAVVLIDSGADMGLEVAERIRSSIAAMPPPPGGEAPTVSIGVATLPGDASTKSELLDKADWAMYLAKRRGRNRCVRFSEEKE
jgi:diguanylate cyclase (GGDEF)-like protein